MKIVHVFQCFGHSCGISVFCAELMKHQIEAGHDCWIVNETAKDFALDKRIKKLTSCGTLDVLGFTPDIVHVHAVWSPFAARAIAWCVKHGIKFVVSPHGCLMPRVMGKGWLKKHVFYWVFLRRNLQKAHAIHCTGEGERDAVRAMGLRPSAVIAPLGCYLPDWPVSRIASSPKTVLFLSRIGEEKGLLLLVEAWGSIKHDGWQLLLAGPDWEGYRRVVEDKILSNGVADVEFVGSADAKMKDVLYRAADLFVLPSPMENFSMVVLDALAYGVPVICTRGTPWKAITEHECGWWIEPNSAVSIANAIRQGMEMSDEDRSRLGNSARKLSESFDWKKVTQIMLDVYK